jgi:hypothetical protein
MTPRYSLHEPEDTFMRWVIDLARWHKYKVFHPHDSRKSEEGWPDLAMARPDRPLLLVETKTLTGKVTRAQREWIDVLQQTRGLRAEVWKPDMRQHIEALIVHGMD